MHCENIAKLTSLSLYSDEQHCHLQSRNICAVPQIHMSYLNSHITHSVCVQSFYSFCRTYIEYRSYFQMVSVQNGCEPKMLSHVVEILPPCLRNHWKDGG